MINIFIAASMILMTIFVFILSMKIYSKHPIVIFNPSIFCSAVIIIILLVSDISYDIYMIGGEWIHHFLGSAVVALAFPLYKQREIVKKYFIPIVTGVFAGIIVSFYTGIFIFRIIGAAAEYIPSAATKSITTAIAVQVTEQLGGLPSLTAVFVMIAGVSGVILGPLFIKVFKINNPVGRGMLFGNASHAIGTTKAFEYNSETGTISSTAMILTAIFASIIIPIFY